MKTIQHFFDTHSFLNGQWVLANKGTTFAVTNPATGETIAEVADLSRKDIAQAIDKAHVAFPGWAALAAKQRSAILLKWHQLILEYKDALAHLITLECGKPLAESLSEVLYGASFLEWFAEEGKRIYGDVIPANTKDKRIVVIKQPIGVAAAITPWNFPMAMITRKVAPALAAGCTSVVKPAEATPLTALLLGQIGEQAGIPAGVLNIVTTLNSSEAGLEFCENSKIKKLSFTGSTKVGKILLKQSSENVTKVSLELGGNSPFILFEDADVQAAIKGLMSSKFRNAGQTCVCANRILVHEKIYDEFIEQLVKEVDALKVGNGLEPNVTIGPLINKSGLNKVADIIADAMQHGATCVRGGSVIKELFFEPTILANVDISMRLAKEEIFGPVIPVFKFKTEEEAIALANDTIYGLAAYFYSRDVNRCWRVSEALEYGMVGINEGIISTEVAPFGGIKQSGIGREGSKYGIEEYTEMKYLCYGNL